jgi:hypothetical protein
MLQSKQRSDCSEKSGERCVQHLLEVDVYKQAQCGIISRKRKRRRTSATPRKLPCFINHLSRDKRVCLRFINLCTFARRFKMTAFETAITQRFSSFYVRCTSEVPSGELPSIEIVKYATQATGTISPIYEAFRRSLRRAKHCRYTRHRLFSGLLRQTL